MDSNLPTPGKKGTTPPLIRRRVQASTTCFAPDPRPKPSGGAPEFSVQLKCNVTKYTTAGPESGQRSRIVYRGDGAEASFSAAAGDRNFPCGEDGVRRVVRRLLRSIRPLRQLDLTDGEWEAILPEDVVPPLAEMARGSLGGAAVVDLAVDLKVRFSAPRVLLTACEEAVAKDGDQCSICFDAMREEEEAAAAAAAPAARGVPVELPGCGHTFHRRCISAWFGRKPMCPLCRGDVAKHLDPDLQSHLIAVFSGDRPGSTHYAG